MSAPVPSDEPVCKCGYALTGLPGDSVTCPECGTVCDKQLSKNIPPDATPLDFVALTPWLIFGVTDVVGGFGHGPEARGANWPAGILLAVACSTAVLIGLCCTRSTRRSGRLRHATFWWLLGNAVISTATILLATLMRGAAV